MHPRSTVLKSIESGARDGRTGPGRLHRLPHSIAAASAQDRLTYWRDRYRHIMETLETGLPLHSIARPALEEDLGAAAEMIAHCEAQAAEEQRAEG